MSRYDDIDAIISALGVGATFDQMEYALRDYPDREVRTVLAERLAAGAATVGPGDDFIFVANGRVGGVPFAVPAGGGQPIVLEDIRHDTQSWLGTGSYASPNWWGKTFPEGSWLLLPAGIYWAEVSLDWDGDPGAGASSWFADIDDRFSDNIDLWYADSQSPLHYNFPPAIGTGAQKWSSLLRVKETGAPYHWGLVAQHEQVGDVDLNSINLAVMRISQFGGV